jgi:galactonate dehydratase
VYTIQQRHAPKEKYQSYLDIAEKCQAQISSMGENESLAKRYSVVLEELRLEAVRKPQQHLEFSSTNSGREVLQRDLTVPSMALQLGQLDHLNSLQRQETSFAGDMSSNYANETMHSDSQNTMTPSSLMADLTSWGEFDSLVGFLSLCSPS